MIIYDLLFRVMNFQDLYTMYRVFVIIIYDTDIQL